jgi:hypothetical protein
MTMSSLAEHFKAFASLKKAHSRSGAPGLHYDWWCS